MACPPHVAPTFPITWVTHKREVPDQVQAFVSARLIRESETAFVEHRSAVAEANRVVQRASSDQARVTHRVEFALEAKRPSRCDTVEVSLGSEGDRKTLIADHRMGIGRFAMI